MSDPTTVLTISTFGVPPYSARGLTQALEPIAPAVGNVFRTINGGLLDLSRGQFKKYKSTITQTNDQNPPANDAFWPGQEITIDCIAELSYPVGGSPSRSVVPDSAYTESGFIIYRPVLVMRVTAFTATKDEYGATTSWTLESEEA